MIASWYHLCDLSISYLSVAHFRNSPIGVQSVMGLEAENRIYTRNKLNRGLSDSAVTVSTPEEKTGYLFLSQIVAPTMYQKELYIVKRHPDRCVEDERREMNERKRVKTK